MKQEILTVIPDEELPLLRDLYRRHCKFAPYVFSFITTAIKWRRKCNKTGKDEGACTRFYCANGDWQTDGTFIAYMPYACYDFFVFTMDPQCRRLYEALTKTKRFDYHTTKPLFYAVHQLHVDTVLRVLKDVDVQVHHATLTDIWAMDIPNALNLTIECPPDVYLKRLTVEHAPIINSLWPHKYEGSVKYIETFIKMNGGYGVFVRDTDEIAAWILKNQMGTMGILQTVDGHKRKGYGSLVTKVLAKEIAAEGHVPLGTVLADNEASRTMFRRAGFEVIGQVTYIDCN